MNKFVNIVFWLSLFIWFVFLLTVLVMGAMSITQLGGLKVWLLPIISFFVFAAVTTMKSVKKFYD